MKGRKTVVVVVVVYR